MARTYWERYAICVRCLEDGYREDGRHDLLIGTDILRWLNSAKQALRGRLPWNPPGDDRLCGRCPYRLELIVIVGSAKGMKLPLDQRPEPFIYRGHHF